MGTQTQVELEAFHRFLSRQISNSDTELTPEECLELWRAENPSSEELEESIKAIKRALQEAEEGQAWAGDLCSPVRVGWRGRRSADGPGEWC